MGAPQGFQRHLGGLVRPLRVRRGKGLLSGFNRAPGVRDRVCLWGFPGTPGGSKRLLRVRNGKGFLSGSNRPKHCLAFLSIA